jgi:hypothetical protein
MELDGKMAEKLDDLFFLKEDQKLIDQLKAMKKLKETKEELKKVSGIENEHILDKLVELNVRPETLATLSLVPLIEVAWADGSLDESEKKAVLSSADKMGFSKDSGDYQILQQWMTHKPTKDLLDAWIHYIKGLCEQLSKDETQELKNELIGHARSIASASGGLFGIGNKISKAESAMLETLEKAFC